jgi:two-component system vancomycin resistance associated response regulator VraR
MDCVRILTPDPAAEMLLSLMAAQLPEVPEPVIFLDAVWMNRAREFPGHKIILFTTSADPGFLEVARNSEAAGFWYLQPSMEALARVLAGEPAFPDHAPIVELGKARSTNLTNRELDVLRQMAKGKSDAQIGDALSISVSTVKHHIQQLRSKTGLANRTQLAVEAIRSGLIGNNRTFV